MNVAKSVIEVYEYSGGIVGPGIPSAGTVRDGGTIRTGTPPGCWGPMITPKFQGGHEPLTIMRPATAMHRNGTTSSTNCGPRPTRSTGTENISI